MAEPMEELALKMPTPSARCGCGPVARFGEAEEKMRPSERPLAANEGVKHRRERPGEEEEGYDVAGSLVRLGRIPGGCRGQLRRG